MVKYILFLEIYHNIKQMLSHNTHKIHGTPHSIPILSVINGPTNENSPSSTAQCWPQIQPPIITHTQPTKTWQKQQRRHQWHSAASSGHKIRPKSESVLNWYQLKLTCGWCASLGSCRVMCSSERLTADHICLPRRTTRPSKPSEPH